MGAIATVETPEMIAWAAGLFEGEGSIGFYENNNMGSLRLSLVMTDKDVLQRFASVVGRGEVRTDRSKRLAHWKPAWRWQCGAKADVEAVMRLIGPYLCQRRQTQWSAARAALEKHNTLRHQESHSECFYCGRGFYRWRRAGSQRVYCSKKCAGRAWHHRNRKTGPRSMVAVPSALSKGTRLALSEERGLEAR